MLVIVIYPIPTSCGEVHELFTGTGRKEDGNFGGPLEGPRRPTYPNAVSVSITKCVSHAAPFFEPLSISQEWDRDRESSWNYLCFSLIINGIQCRAR